MGTQSRKGGVGIFPYPDGMLVTTIIAIALAGAFNFFVAGLCIVKDDKLNSDFIWVLNLITGFYLIGQAISLHH